MSKNCAMCMKKLTKEDDLCPCLVCVVNNPRLHYPLWCEECYLLHLKFHGQKGVEFLQDIGEKELFDAVALQESMKQLHTNNIGIL